MDKNRRHRFDFSKKMTTFTLHSNILFSQKSCVWLLAPVRLLPPPPQTPTLPLHSQKLLKYGDLHYVERIVWGGGEGKEGHMRNTVYDLQILFQSSPLSPPPRRWPGVLIWNLQGGGGWRGFWRIVINCIHMYNVRYLLLPLSHCPTPHVLYAHLSPLILWDHPWEPLTSPSPPPRSQTLRFWASQLSAFSFQLGEVYPHM